MQSHLKKKYLLFIPARAGSKGLPNKNTLDFAGKPLICWTVDSAIKTRAENKLVFISTDSQEILDISSSRGIDQTYLRPAKISQDDSLISDAIIDAINYLKNEKKLIFENIILLQPTSPLRDCESIDRAIATFEENNKPTLVSISKMIEHPSECIQLGENGGWNYLIKPPHDYNGRQSYQDNYFFINGAIYIANTEYFLENRKFLTQSETQFFEMDSARSVDIDYPVDFFRALNNLELINKGIL